MALKKREISLVFATSTNGIIGSDNQIPWKCSADLLEFKRITLGGTVIMGRKTWESLPIKPLPGRENIVITRDMNYIAEGAIVVHSVEDAISHANNYNLFFIGGAQIYEQAAKYAHTLYRTVIGVEVQGDAFAPSDEKLTELGFVHLAHTVGLPSKAGEPSATLEVYKRKYAGDDL